MNRGMPYLAINLGFAMLVAAGSPQAAASGVHPLYLLALFALCSAPLLYLRRLNDRHALPGLFFMAYFMFFGVLDLFHLLTATPGPRDLDWLSLTEGVILAAGACACAGYLLVSRTLPGMPPPQRDWPEAALTFGGGLLWLVSTWLSWRFKTMVVVDTSVDNQEAALNAIGPLMAALYILATYLQPLGILMLAYAQARYRRGWMLPLLAVVVLVQLLYGFVEDVKGDAMLGMIIVLLTRVLVDGRLPRSWLVTAVLFLALAWPVMQANRAVRDRYNLNHGEAAANILQTLERAMEVRTSVMAGSQRAETFFERASLKGSVEMIVQGVARGVPLQNGYTLSPIPFAFVPRLLWPNKPDVPTGLLVNKVFQVAPDQPDTYISPSHLGEMYWNFGWSGALGGMLLFGLLLGWLGVRFELSGGATLSRVMVTVVTIRLMVLGFESSIAAEYVMWLRSMAAIGLLHLLLARRTAGGAATGGEEPAAEVPAAALPFPNLMR